MRRPYIVAAIALAALAAIWNFLARAPRNIETGLVDFEYVTIEQIDRETGAWAEGPHKGEIVPAKRAAA